MNPALTDLQRLLVEELLDALEHAPAEPDPDRTAPTDCQPGQSVGASLDRPVRK